MFVLNDFSSLSILKFVFLIKFIISRLAINVETSCTWGRYNYNPMPEYWIKFDET